ncbi:MAG: glycosyltransferase family 39 protein [Gemmatimonadota bacterium]|nr:glycosyltransferase family 39 protein [Gemmatimonadota bacterium]
MRAASHLPGHAALFALCAAAAVLLLWRLGDGSLYDWDEAIYAQVAKEIVETGDWLTLHWGYEPFFEKPPLLMWSTAIWYHLFGVSEFWARATSALSGIALVALVYAIARRLYGAATGFAAGIVLLTTHQFVLSARFGTTDVLLTLWVYLCVYAYLRVQEGSFYWWYVVGIGCGLAIMTKSAAGVVAPAAIGVALLLDRRLAAALRTPSFWGGIGAGVVIAASWHVAMVLLHGDRFVDVYLGRHLLERATSPMEGHVGGRDFYLGRLRTHFFPWFYLLPFALAEAGREAAFERARGRILLVLAVLVFGLYTAVQTKIYWYLVPIYPALAILVARTAVRAVRQPRSAAFSGLAVATAVLLLLAPQKLTLLFAALVVGAAAVDWRRGSMRAVPLAMALFLVAAGANEIRPLFAGGESSIARLARAAGRAYPPGTALIVYGHSGLYKPAPLFYSDTPIRMAHTPEELAAASPARGFRMILLPQDSAAPLQSRFGIRELRRDGGYVLAQIARLPSR